MPEKHPAVPPCPPYKTKAARAACVSQELSRLYPETRIPLGHTDAFTLLVAVVLSAQCSDKRVNEVTPRLFALAGTPEKMSRVSVPEIRRIIRPCGLSRVKSEAISALSKIIVRKHGGQAPRTFGELEALPGVGHKTASVVMAQAWGEPAFPVDRHIHRLAFRWGLSNGSNVARTERDLKKLFPPECWNALHLRIIYYGREHCTARGCDGTVCGICRMLFPNRKRAVRIK